MENTESRNNALQLESERLLPLRDKMRQRHSDFVDVTQKFDEHKSQAAFEEQRLSGELQALQAKLTAAGEEIERLRKEGDEAEEAARAAEMRTEAVQCERDALMLENLDLKDQLEGAQGELASQQGPQSKIPNNKP